MIPLSIEGHVHYLINVSPCISFCDGLCSLVFLWLLLRESSHKEYVRVSVSSPNLRIVFGIRTIGLSSTPTLDVCIFVAIGDMSWRVCRCIIICTLG